MILSPRKSAWVIRSVFVVAALITLIWLAISIENYRAKRAWGQCKLQLEQKGETLDWSALVANPVADEQNFLATPVLAPCFGFGRAADGKPRSEPDTNAWQQLASRLESLRKLPGQGDWRTGTLRSLSDWSEMANPKIDQLQTAIEENKVFFAEVRTAARRPFSQLKLGPWTALDSQKALAGQFETLKTLKELAQIFTSSARVELVNGDIESARSDIEVVFSLADAAASQPVLIGFLVKASMIDLAAQPLLAGVAEHRWSEPELARLESRLNQLNIVADYRRCIRGERAFAVALLAAYPNLGYVATQQPDNDSSRRTDRVATPWLRWPRALIYRNQINVAMGYSTFLKGRIDPAGPNVNLIPRVQDDPALEKYRSASIYNVIFPQLLRTIERSIHRVAAVQATVTIARVACALERHRIAKGRYPKSLGELSPQFLSRIPVDPVNGAPLKYELIGETGYVLYSIGVDGVDDQGKPTKKPQRSEEIPTGDWVWKVEE